MSERVETPRHNSGHEGWSSDAPGGQKIGYARVSRKGQVLDRQIDALQADGCLKVFTDHGVTGTTIRRPGLDDALDYLRPGDVLVVQTLDRLSRRTGEMLEFTSELKARGIGFRVLAFPEIDTTGPFGTALLTILGALAQMERDVLAERVQDGLAAARARGRTGGGRGRSPRTRSIQPAACGARACPTAGSRPASAPPRRPCDGCSSSRT